MSYPEDQPTGGRPAELPDGGPDAEAVAERAEPPVTGEPEVDRALESLQGLESAPLADHHDRLARVHEDLHSVLNADLSAPQS